jgi:3'-5' exoribonuclease
MKKLFVDQVSRDQDVNDFFLVVKKGLYSSRNNTRYASVTLKDRTGTIEARIWDRADDLSARFERNDIVYVESKARMYQDRLQLTITNVRKEERVLTADEIRDFYPESGPGTDRMRAEFSRIVGEIENEHLVRLFAQMQTRKEIMDAFCLVPASVGVHHVSIGGLLEHSVAVADMAKNAAGYMGLDKDIVVTGSLLHDIGKIEEITLRAGGFSYSDRGRLLGHITLGIMILEDLIGAVEGFPDCLSDVLKHIVLSHHGESEWGSPKRPMCLEAMVVHYIDNLDAKVKGVREHMANNMEDERWTQFHRLYESRFYKIPER